MNVSTDGLPPEMQQRIAQIIEKAKSDVQPGVPNTTGPAAAPAQASIQRPPTLMDHTVALRQEVAALRNELHAVAQVTDAAGQAGGQLYQTFLGQSEFTDQGSAYETQGPDEVSDY